MISPRLAFNVKAIERFSRLKGQEGGLPPLDFGLALLNCSGFLAEPLVFTS